MINKSETKEKITKYHLDIYFETEADVEALSYFLKKNLVHGKFAHAITPMYQSYNELIDYLEKLKRELPEIKG